MSIPRQRKLILSAVIDNADMSEKKVEESTVGEQNVDYGIGNVRNSHTASRRKSSAVDPAIIAGEIFDERYETTHRGLKSR